MKSTGQKRRLCEVNGTSQCFLGSYYQNLYLSTILKNSAFKDFRCCMIRRYMIFAVE
jgi:hypothetical protein